MQPQQIKNIFWDVDGVLADLNYAYFHFLTKHPNYRNRYADLKWEQLPEVLPIIPEYGALELKTHPELGTQMDQDFCADQAYFRNRPLYPGVIETLKHLDQLGYRQFTMSATFDVEAKTAYLNDILAPVTNFLTIECVQHGTFMHDTAKQDSLKAAYQKYNLKPDETILVDDRIYNQYAAIESGAHPVRLRCPFTSDLPEDLTWIPEFKNIQEVADWLTA
ncbi:HAD family hydrolase [Rubritalea tangerina]|uniref:phosphoglycolate phosphatase n=1 Tax=Rubritalea tangerina TaxID=430798 RepID=A0ABW4ZFG1_9BACT